MKSMEPVVIARLICQAALQTIGAFIAWLLCEELNWSWRRYTFINAVLACGILLILLSHEQEFIK